MNQAQMPVANIRIGGSERLTMKPILPGRSLDLPDVTVTGPIRVDLGFFSGGVRDVLLPDVLLSRGGTVREGEPVRFVVPRLGAQHVAQILTRGIGAGDPAFPRYPTWTAGNWSGQSGPLRVTFSPSGKWTRRGPGAVVTSGIISEVSWLGNSISFRLNDELTVRLDEPYTSFVLPHVEKSARVRVRFLEYRFSLE